MNGAPFIAIRSEVRPMSDLPTGTATFLFTDIEGSTRLWEEYPEAMREALARHDALLRAAIETNGGHVFKRMGDGFCAVFTTPVAAVEAALSAQQAFCSEVWAQNIPLPVRMALHTGEAQQREDDYFGPVVNRVARLLTAGHGGQVLLSQATKEALGDALPERVVLRDLGAHRLKDLAQPEVIFRLEHPALPAVDAPLRSLEAFSHNLPVQVTRFIGREKEMAEVKDLLSATRLLTLTGAGGIGKTRLALQIAAELLEGYEDGVWLADLASLSDPALVLPTVAAALGVREEPGRPLAHTVVDYLKPRRLLLLLDNCEHLLPACAALAEAILRGCPDVQVLATSREGLNIAGERIYRLPSLALPVEGCWLRVEGGSLTSTLNQQPSTLLESEAVRLFVDRAAAAVPTFAVTNHNAPAVAQVCYRLDGIPLALELAAARLKTLSVEAIAERLDDRFRLLTGGSRTALPRQQTLRALIDWSYDLLSEPERMLLRRLSVFAGGWTLEAAEAVGSSQWSVVSEGSQETEGRRQEAGGREAAEGQGEGGFPNPQLDVLDLLAALESKSLVVYEEREGEGRYRLLETVRQYCWARLVAAGEVALVRDRHRDYFVELAERAETELQGPHQRVWLERLEAEHDNLRAAREWCLSDKDEGGPPRGHPKDESDPLHPSSFILPPFVLRLVRALERFWIMRGTLSEGREWLRELLERGSTPAAVRAEACVEAGQFAHYQGDLAAAQALYEEGVTLFRQLDDKPRLAWALNGLGEVTNSRGDHAAARPLYEEGLALFREVGNDGGIASALYRLAGLAREEGDPARARALYEESIALFRRSEDQRSLAPALASLGAVAREQGDDARARALWEESLAFFRQQGDPWALARWLEHLGRLAYQHGDYVEARALYQESLTSFQELGDRRSEARLLGSLGIMAQKQGDYGSARTMGEEALARWREIGDRLGTAEALTSLANTLGDQGDYAGARPLLEESLTLRRQLGERVGVAWTLYNIADLDRWEGDLTSAQSRYEEGLTLMRQLGHQQGAAYGLHNLGLVAYKQGDFASARALYLESLERMRKLGDRWAMAYALERLAALAAEGQRREEGARRAARLLGAAETLRDVLGSPVAPADRPDHDATVAAVCAALSGETFAAAWAEGQAMTLEQAVEYALEDAGASPGPAE
jgi:predicted ATPase/class 3 adenylate cyclase/Tfp pilus assembly protein PilF